MMARRSGMHVVPVRSITGVSSGEEGIAGNALTGVVMFAFFAALFLVKETSGAMDAPGARVRASKHGLEGASVEPFMEAVLSAVVGADRGS